MGSGGTFCSSDWEYGGLVLSGSMVVVDDELEGMNWLWYEVKIWVSFKSVVIEINGLCEFRRYLETTLSPDIGLLDRSFH